MQTSTLTALLGDTWFGAGLPVSARAKMAAVGSLAEVPVGTVLIREGARCESIGVVVDGRVAIRLGLPGHEERTVLTIEPGDVFGWSAVLPPAIATSTCVTVSPSRVILFDGVGLGHGDGGRAGAGGRGLPARAARRCAQAPRPESSSSICIGRVTSRVSAATVFLPRAELDRLFTALRADGRTMVGPDRLDDAVVYDESRPGRATGRPDRDRPGSYRLRSTGRIGCSTTSSGVRLEAVHASGDRAVARGRRGHRRRVGRRANRPRLAFVGVRACELAALDIQDRAMRAGPLGDADHAARGDAALVVAVECATAAGTCFCTSMGTGPEVTEAPTSSCRSWPKASSSDPGPRPERSSSTSSHSRGRARRDRRGSRPGRRGPASDRRSDPGRRPAGAAPRGARSSSLGRGRGALPRLRELHACLPDLLLHQRAVASDLDGVEATTERPWDSCFSLGFGRVAGDANFRPRVRDRYRQWLTHKFSTWWDQFGSTGCVGCGRCIAWCPVGIDVREELLAIAPIGAPAGPIPWPVSPPEGRAPARLATVDQPRHVTVRLESIGRDRGHRHAPPATSDGSLLAARPGQFVMVELPGHAIPPISISRIRPDGLDLTIRSVGPATAAMIALTSGAELSLRGPLGRGWPIETAVGRDVVIVAGGIGLAPLRPLIDAILAERPRFGAVRLYLGARTPNDRLFVPETDALAGRVDVEIAEIVDRAGADWFGRVGVVTQLFDQATWDGSRATAFLCGPERMMQATATTLERLGVAPARTWLTLERNMACGVGTVRPLPARTVLRLPRRPGLLDGRALHRIRSRGPVMNARCLPSRSPLRPSERSGTPPDRDRQVRIVRRLPADAARSGGRAPRDRRAGRPRRVRGSDLPSIRRPLRRPVRRGLDQHARAG